MRAGEPGPESCGARTSPIPLQPHRGWPTHSVAPSDQPSCAIVCAVDCGRCWPTHALAAGLLPDRRPTHRSTTIHEANWRSICDRTRGFRGRLIALVIGYQRAFEGRPSPCRFTPSCSSYALEALNVHGTDPWIVADACADSSVADHSARPGTTQCPKERDNPMIAGLFEPPAALLAWFYSFTHNYIIAISMIALVIMIITAPLVLKSTKGMLEMQKLQPEMRKLQQEHRGDRQKLNEEMMKLYQQHKVNPMASCFPLLLADAGVHHHVPGAARPQPTREARDIRDSHPQYISTSSELYHSSGRQARDAGMGPRPGQASVGGDRRSRSARASSTPCWSWLSACSTTCSRRWWPPGLRWRRTCRRPRPS